MATAARTQAPTLAQVCDAMAERNRTQRAQFEALMPEGGIAQFIQMALDGTNTRVNIGGAMNVEQAERMIIAAIEPHLDTKLDRQQRAAVEFEVSLAWQRRIAERKAALADIQQRLASPSARMFA